MRPTLINFETSLDKPIVEFAITDDSGLLFLEMSNIEPPNNNKDYDVVFYFEYYDPATEKIEPMCYKCLRITSKVSDMIPELVRRAKLPANTQVWLCSNA